VGRRIDSLRSALVYAAVDVKTYKLGEPFEVWGHWWLPAFSDKPVAGKLSSYRGHLELKLLGTFDGVDVNHRGLVVPVIHGVADAKEFTLWRCVQDQFSFRFPGGVEQTFEKLRVIVGGHFPPDGESKFSAVAFDAQQIGPWMAQEPVKQDVTFSDQGLSQMSCAVNEDRARVCGPASDGVRYRFSSNIESRHEPFSTYGYDTTPGVYIEFPEPLPVAQTIERVERTVELLTLLVGEDVEPESIRLYVPTEKSGFELLYEFRPPEKQKLIAAREVLAPLPKLGDAFIPMLDRWDVERARMGDTVNLLRDVLDRDAPASHVRMLLLAQALEAFHRSVIGGEYLSKEDYEPIRRILAEAIPPSVKSDHRAALESKIRYGNELSLRTRLKQLLGKVSDEGLARLQIDRKSFVRDVVDARNDFTHWQQERERARPNGAHLANLLSSLLALTQLLVLLHLGVDEGLVIGRMLETPWRYLRRYKPIN
jgi:hypothetical protein